MEQKIRVLLADSDSEFCARMAAALENAGDMELVGIAEDGAKALAAVGELRPELLIIDLVLPVMDGIHGAQPFARAGTDFSGDRWRFLPLPVRRQEPELHSTGRGHVFAQADGGRSRVRAHPHVGKRAGRRRKPRGKPWRSRCA